MAGRGGWRMNWWDNDDPVLFPRITKLLGMIGLFGTGSTVRTTKELDGQ
jgi:hypothetical protein